MSAPQIVYGQIAVANSTTLAGYTFPGGIRVVSNELQWTIDAAKIPGDDFTKSTNGIISGRTIIVQGVVGAGMVDSSNNPIYTRDELEAELQLMVGKLYFVGDSGATDDTDSWGLLADPNRRFLPLQIGDADGRFIMASVRSTPSPSWDRRWPRR